MCIGDAKELVELVIETLYDWGVIPENNYGRMTMDQTERLAEMVKEKSEE